MTAAPSGTRKRTGNALTIRSVDPPIVAKTLEGTTISARWRSRWVRGAGTELRVREQEFKTVTGRQENWRSHMKPIAVLGIILIVLGLGALAYKGITYTTHETVVDVGPIHATAERQKTMPLPPAVGITVVVGGVALLIVAIRKRGWTRTPN